MKIKLKIFLRLFIALCFINKVSAEHIVGGVISYECLGDGAAANTKRMQFKIQLFYDCNTNNSFDQKIEVGIYRGTPGSYRFFRMVEVGISNSSTELLDDKSCALLLNNVCVKPITYLFQMEDLPIISENYMIAFQRCCRNMTITNITDPGRTGSTIVLEMGPDAVRLCNSSPQFDKTLPLVACVNEEMNLALNGTDKENDMITYELCAPYIGGGPRGMSGSAGNASECGGISPNPASCVPELKEVTFRGTNLNATNPFPSDIPFSLTNGVFNAKPNTLGQFIFGICIKEYRNGVLLTSQRRDVQINFARCDINIKAAINFLNTSNGIPLLNHCDNSIPFRITNLSEDSNYIKSTEWELTHITGNKIRDTNFHFFKLLTDTGLYQGTLIINKGNTCSDSLQFIVKVGTKLPASFLAPEYNGCINTTVNFKPTSPPGYLIRMKFGDGTKDSLIKYDLPFNYTYKLPGTYNLTAILVDNNGCTAIENFSIKVFPQAINTVSLIPIDTPICYPSIITVGINENIDSFYQYTWTLSNGKIYTGIKPQIPINTPGSFKIKLNLRSPANCVLDTTFNTSFSVTEKPIASFNLKNNNLTLKNPELIIDNRSKNANRYLWDFGNNNSSTLQNPIHIYTQNGNFRVQLIVENDNGCKDTTFQIVTVGNVSEVFTPNVFTPNGDGVNDIFLPKVVADITSYELTIFNRWGSLLFKSSDPEIGWDGRNQSIQSAPIGVYIYQIKISFPDQATKVVKGSVTLVR